MSRLIAIYSPAPQCGKTTIAKHLESLHGFTHLDFRGPIRAMVTDLLFSYRQGSLAEDTRMIRGTINSRFTQTTLPYNPTPEHLMNTLEREWGEQCIGPLFWVRFWYQQAKLQLENGRSVVCDDLRTPDQLAAVKRLGGEFWRVTRPGYAARPELDCRSLDGALDGQPTLWHHSIQNDGTIEMLNQYVDAVMRMEVAS
jgi:hypothetical protein